MINHNNIVIGCKFKGEEEVFMFGLGVQDFKNIDYNSITALNIQAIKGLYQIIQILLSK